MVNLKVSQLPTATTVTASDTLLVVQGGVTKQVTQDVVAASIAASAQLSTTTATLWKASTVYAVGQAVINPSGQLTQVTSAHTSTSSYDASKFTITGGGSITPGATRNALTGWYHADGFGADFSGAAPSTNAVQAAVNALTAAGGSGKLYFPAGTYRVGTIDFGGCNGVEVLGAARGATIIKAPTGQTNTLSYIFGATSACSAITFRDMSFVGTAVDDVTGPRRARTYTGYGFNSAIRFTGDLSGSGAVVSDITVSNIEVIGSGGNDASGTPTYSGLPVFLIGIRGHAKIEKSRFYNTLDVGWTFCESAVCTDNVSVKSADNGFSISRGNQAVTAVGNRVVGAAYNGIWVSGFNTDAGPTDITVTGNNIKNVGYCGIIADSAPRGAVIVGNIIDGGYYRGPSDGVTDSYGTGVYVGSLPAGSATPTAFAQDVLIAANTIRNMPRAGVAVNGGKNIKVTGNHIIDVGTQFAADGSTAVASTDTNQNIGILFINSGNASTCTIDSNSIIDQRATPYLNYGIRPQAAPTQSSYLNNTVQGARNIYDFIETSYTSTAVRRFSGITQFDTNMKLPGGATAGSNSGGGAALGYDINGAAGSIRPIRWLTASSERWRLYTNTTAESGSNAGSDLVLESKTDTGAGLATVLSVTRSSGAVAFTVSPTVPTPGVGDSSSKVASTGFVSAAVAALVNSSPAVLDTLKELADAIGDDANFSTTVMNALAGKAPLASPAFTGTPTVPTAAAGTSSTQAASTAFVAAALAGLITIVDNGDGTVNLTGPGVVDNGDGTVSFTSAAGKVVYSKTQLDTLLAGKVPMPGSSDATGAVPTKQAGGGIAYVVPSGGGSAVNVQVFEANGTWTKPAGVTTVQVQLVAGGSGGGSGGRYASGTASSGGGGGAGGPAALRTFPASALPSTVSITVGAGGNGGAAIGTDTTAGAAGSGGGNSMFGTYARVNAASAGGGGGTTAGTAGGGNNNAMYSSGGGAAGGLGTTGSTAGSAATGSAGGGGGGGISTGAAAFAGGSGGFSLDSNSSVSGGAANTAGTAGTDNPSGLVNVALGGGGGGSSVTGAGGAGGQGGKYGGGGGGGGAALNGNASGAGGKGGTGVVVVTAW